jgi:predicted NBD/HSP70 family sugar kinase
VLRRDRADAPQALRGANQVGLRAANERLVLSLIRTHGQLSKAQIAELSGLTAQTASVICRGLVEAGLLIAGAPIKGKVGQPFVPLSLNPEGAFFFGLQVGDREAALALINFTGTVIAERRLSFNRPTLEGVIGFADEEIRAIRKAQPSERDARLQGLGVALAPGALDRFSSRGEWDPVETSFAELGRSLSLATYLSSEVVAACGAEIIYGLGVGLSDFIYVFLGHSIEGGMVQKGRIKFSRDGRTGNIGRVPVPDGDGLVRLADLLKAPRGRGSGNGARAKRIGEGLAYAVYSAMAVAGCNAVIIDGSVATALRRQISDALRSRIGELEAGAAASLIIRDGTHDRRHQALGAACLPLVDRFFPEPISDS